MPVPFTPANTTARDITQSCDATWAANNDDCNKFVKAALGSFLAAAYFDGLNADGNRRQDEDGGGGVDDDNRDRRRDRRCQGSKVVIRGNVVGRTRRQHMATSPSSSAAMVRYQGP